MANANTEALIRERLAAAGGRLPWAEVMRLALYEPGLGYYRRGVRRIGRGGDFYTSVSVGPVFGELLGVFAARVWRALGEPGDFWILEQGAHDGTLAADVLRGLERNEPSLFAGVRYGMIEPDAAHRVAQRATLGDLAGKLVQAEELGRLHPAPEHAVFLCNELPDAMPVHRVRFSGGAWQEWWVRAAGEGFEFVPGELSSVRLAEELAGISAEVPERFTTEINLAMLDWIRAVAEFPFRGAVLVLDYGHHAADYFAPERGDGSLRRYRAHRSDERVLEDLGQCDLTAHINFSRLAEAAETAGLRAVEYLDQGRFLTRLFAEAAAGRDRPPEAAWLRQFQSLTHPGIMGRSFQALVLAKGIDPERLASAESLAAARRRLGA